MACVSEEEAKQRLAAVRDAFKAKNPPKDLRLTKDSVTVIRDAVSNAHGCYLELHGMLHDCTMSRSTLITISRRFNNTQVSFKINKDRFMAQYDKFYKALQDLYEHDIRQVLEREEIIVDEDRRMAAVRTVNCICTALNEFGIKA